MQLDSVSLLALIGALTLLSQWLAYQLNLPSILLLLLSGILVGPVLNILDPDVLMGDLLFPVVNLAVAVILFEGSLTLRFQDLHNTGNVLWRMLSIGVLVTWATVASAAHFLVGVDWPLAILFGAIMVVTGPTVIAPMLRAVRPNEKVSKLLRWEGIAIDPIGALLAVVIADVILTVGQGDVESSSLLLLAEMLLVGGVSGAGSGFLVALVLKRHWVPDYLQKVMTLLSVLIVFAISNAISHESGLVAVTVMGIWLANTDVWTDEILEFKESLSILLVSGLFILLAARLDIDALIAIGLPALALVAVVQFVSRPISIALATWPGNLNWRERALLGWIAPRGIVAAAISALFALRLEASGYPGADLLVPLSFSIIIGTVFWQSLTAPLVARWLQVAQPKPTGVLFVGASQIVVELAQKLEKAGFPVMVTSSAWDDIKQARMAGLPTYYGNPVSAHAERYLDLSGIGHLFAMERREAMNAVPCLHFAGEFGRANVFALAPTADLKEHAKHRFISDHRGQHLFGKKVSHAKLSSLLSQGAKVTTTRISEDFSYTDLLNEHSALIPLVSWNEDKNLRVHIADKEFSPAAGETVLSLISTSSEKADAEGHADKQATDA